MSRSKNSIAFAFSCHFRKGRSEAFCDWEALAGCDLAFARITDASFWVICADTLRPVHSTATSIASPSQKRPIPQSGVASVAKLFNPYLFLH